MDQGSEAHVRWVYPRNGKEAKQRAQEKISNGCGQRQSRPHGASQGSFVRNSAFTLSENRSHSRVQNGKM